MIFVDSSVFIGLADTKDQWHEKAKGILRLLEKENLMISDLVISEVLTEIGRRSGGAQAHKLYNYFNDNCIVVYLDKELMDSAETMFTKFDGALSLADTASVMIMKKNGITGIASFDSDFDRVREITRISG